MTIDDGSEEFRIAKDKADDAGVGLRVEVYNEDDTNRKYVLDPEIPRYHIMRVDVESPSNNGDSQIQESRGA